MLQLFLYMSDYIDIELGKEYIISDVVRRSLLDKKLNELSINYVSNNICIYILKLSNNKYYIGKSNNIFIRYRQHLNGNGSFWTKKYKPLYIERLIEDCDDYDEDKYVKIYMNMYGIDNVRGGTYIHEKITYFTRKILINEIRMANNLCLCCGSNKHFAKTCKCKNICSFIFYIFNKIKTYFK